MRAFVSLLLVLGLILVNICKGLCDQDEVTVWVSKAGSGQFGSDKQTRTFGGVTFEISPASANFPVFTIKASTPEPAD